MTPVTPSRSVMAQVATPFINVQLGWVTVEGLWHEAAPKVLARWQARRTAHARWGPVTPAQRLIWRDKGL